MSDNTLKQVLLARDQMMNEFERASESSRTALSAISGRNILKTKTETAKIRRDEEIAAQNRAAQIAMAQAGQEISMEQSRLSFERSERNRSEQKRRADRSLVEQERRSIRSVEAQELADRRQEAMDMLALGIYDPSFSADLGFKDSVVRTFAEKKNAEFQQKQAAKAKAAKAKADYEQAIAAIKAGETVSIQKKVEQKKEKVSVDDETPEKIKSGVREAIEYAEKTGQSFKDLQEAREWIAFRSGIDSRSRSQMEAALRYFDYAMEERVLKKRLSGMTAEGYTALEKLAAPSVKNVKTKKEALSVQVQEKAPEWAKETVKRLEKIIDTAGSLESAKEKETFRIADAYVMLQEAETVEDRNAAYSYYLDRLEKGIGSTTAATEQIYTKAKEKFDQLEKLSDEEKKELEIHIKTSEGMVAALENALKNVDLTVDQQEIVSGAAEYLKKSLPALKQMQEYAVTYEENEESYESQKEYRKMDDIYGGYSVEELEALQAEQEKMINARLPGYVQWLKKTNYAENSLADVIVDGQEKKYSEYKKETDKLAKYIENRKTNEKNAAEDQEVEQWAKSYAGKNWAEKVSKLHSDVRRRWEDLMQYSTIMSGNAQYARDQMTLRLEYDADGKAVYITRDGERLPGVLEGNEETLARVQGEIGELSQKEQKITGAYHRNVVQYAEELIPDDQAAEKAKEFSLEGFSEIAKQYRHGGKYFDGNYRDFETDVEGFAKGDYGFFEKEQADRVLALLAEGEHELAFSYYANVREQALLAEADSLNDWWAGTKGAFSGLTRFLTQGGYMLENMAAGSYERMAGTLGTASHQVTVEKLDQMGFGGEALETIYMGGYTILDMVPAVAVSFVPVVGQAAASGYIFAKSMATTYTEDIAAGKRSDEALTHGVLSGTAEVAMEKILGGIPGLTSKNGLFTKLKGSIEKLALTKGAKTAIKIASSMGAEGFEEFLQEVISPFLSKIASDLNGISDAELEEIDWEEAGRSFLLGAITGGAFSVAYAPFENRAIEIEAARTLQLGEVDQLISLGAQLENKTALKIKEAKQNQQPRYKGKEGAAAFVSAKDIVNIQKSIRKRRVKGAAKTLSTMIEANMEGADPAEIKRAKEIFRKVLTAKTLTLEEASTIAKDERLLSILEGMMGEELLGKDISPRQIALLARLASFTDENGKVSKARLALFKDTFGEFDTQAIEQILYYDSMAGFMKEGVIVEGRADLNETQQEAAETLNILSEMSGIHFLVTDHHQTGDFLASGLMAVNLTDLDQGIFYAIGHQAYQMIMQLEPEKGKNFRETILQAAKNTLGEEGVAEEINTILQQKAVSGLDYSRSMAEDEFCARYYSVMLTQEAYTVDRTELAAVRKQIEAFCNENRVTEQEQRIAREMIYDEQAEAPEAVAGTGAVRFEKGAEAITESQKQAVKLAKVVANAIGIDIVFYDSTIEGTYGANANGFFNEADSSIHLDLQKNLDDRKTIALTMSHELTHFIKQWSVEKFDAFAKFLEEQYGEHGISMDELVKAKQEALGIEDPALAYEEVVCDACERMLLDSKAVEKLAALKQKDQSLFSRIINHIKSLLKRIRAEYSKNNYAPASAEAQALQQMEGVLDQFYALFEDAALDAASNYQAAEGAVDLEGAMKYSLKDGAATEVKKAINNKYYGGDIELTETTPSIVVSQKGAKNLPMAMKASHIRENILTEKEAQAMGLKVDGKTNYHGLGDTLFLKVMDSLEDVTEAYRGTKNADNPNRREKYFLLISQHKNQNGDTINVPVYINEHANCNRVMIDVNKVATVFGKEDLRGYIQKELRKGNIVRIKNRSIQTSEPTAPIAASYGMNTSNNNISQNNQNSQEKNNSTPKQRKVSSLIAPGRNDVVVELAELYRQEGILQEAQGLGGVDADAFLENAYAGVDRLADTDIESAEMLRKVLGAIEQHLGESKVSGDIIAQLENKVKEQRAREYGWKNGGDQIRPGTDFDPETDAIDSLFTSEEVAAQNDGADFAKDFVDMDPFEQAQFAADRQAEIDALFEMESGEAKRASQNASSYMALLSRTASSFAEENASPEAGVSTEVQEERKTFGEKMSESWNMIQRKLVDSGDAVYDIGRRKGDEHLYQYFNMARSSSNAGISMIQNKQTNIFGDTIGKGLNEIFSPIMKKGKAYYEQFQYYLYHLHNIDRMSRESIERTEQARADFELIAECYPEFANLSERDIRRKAGDWSDPSQPAALEYIKALDFKERMEEIRNIPVFGPDVTAEVSEGKAQDLLREHPEFKELGDAVRRYLDNLLQYRVDSGLISKDFAEELRAIYPHYVPTRRVQAEESVEARKSNRASIGKTVGRAEDGVADLVPLHKQIADQTLSVVREGSKNRFGMRLLDLARQGKFKEVVDFEQSADRMIGLSEFEGAIDKMDPFQQEEWENLFMVYDHGTQYTLSVTPELLEAVKALSPEKEKTFWLEEQSHKAVNLYKALITSYNPAFAVRNFARDIQDASLYSKDLKGFLRNYPAAWKEIARNGEYWQKYQALGGTYSSVFDYNQGIIKEEGGWIKRNIGNRIEWLNRAIEQAPRLAEFMATVKKGDGSMDSLMEAMYNAADITVNFGRSGTLGKRLNQNWVPFFNPSIQGWSKACRLLTETKSARQWVGLIAKVALLGIAPSLINDILFGDDDEYEKIKQRDKDVNFLIKAGDHSWLKIPKGRVLSVMGMPIYRIKQLIEGEEIGWGEFISTAADQVAPMNPLTDNVFASALTAIAFNKNWYGGDIVPQSMQDDPKAEQYDATTDKFSIAIGGALNISPKKINYLLDSYTGVAGDIILPMLSVASQQNFLTKAFVIDSEYSNRLQGDFYDTKDLLTEKKNSSKATAADEVKYRWWNHKAKAISEISKEIKQIQGNVSLSKKDKEEALKIQYAARNALLLQSEEEYERYIKAVDERLANDPSASAEEIYREVNREIYGAEMALQIEGKSTYERAQKVVKENNIDFDTFYDIYFDSSVDTDKAAKMIGEGLPKESAVKIARGLEAIAPEQGEESISYLQKYKAIASADVDESEKLYAMSLFASDSDRRRIAIGTEHDISLDQFIMVKENLEDANDAAGKNSASNGRIQAAIASTDGLTRRQQAILWQLFTGSTSAKNNPFSVSTGWETVAKIKAYKKAHEED
ncbi:MAG: hypothetical protein IJN80_05170 [Clostridia bacterium]|nr:hypothetical protein [Clostridia bacterium]